MSWRIVRDIKTVPFNVILIYKPQVKTPPGHGSLDPTPNELS